MTYLLIQELNTITDYAISVENHKMEMDRNLVESTTHLIMRKSSQILKWTVQLFLNQYMACLQILILSCVPTYINPFPNKP